VNTQLTAFRRISRRIAATTTPRRIAGHRNPKNLAKNRRDGRSAEIHASAPPEESREESP
jgi:hypothetical protein